MYASGSATPMLPDDLSWSSTNPSFNDDTSSSQYCVYAVPAMYALTDDIIVRDTAGRQFLLSSDAAHHSATLTPLEPHEVNSLGMFYEPAQDTSWHSIAELRQILYGIGTDAQRNAS